MSLTSVLQNFRVLAARRPLKYVSVAKSLSSKAPPQGVIKKLDPDTGKLQIKKTNIVPKITLITGDNVSITTLQEAEKISKRRDLKLVKIVDVDTKTQRPVYRLMTGEEYHAEDLKQREKRKEERQKNIKGEKILLINCRITQHDLTTQLKRALKWLHKMYEVRVVISGANGNVEVAEKVYSSIDQFFKVEEVDAKLVQKRTKGSDIKFQITPPTYKERKDL
ncbi:translation initiation factor IF-3, mitochondrial [Tribolium madens]|uniref:translation initiation factor IF-3, mitochondrial n=1 Tax=Tribolium madens TaxID=41895 RepID=UPI001CF729B0|nr:translation initiation factor IF-3, mitochondrial [Tribolium madens]